MLISMLFRIRLWKMINKGKRDALCVVVVAVKFLFLNQSITSCGEGGWGLYLKKYAWSISNLILFTMSQL